ncbi:hypothetical protein BD310DRAFT_936058 [Dichomitus squalens]|uniref:DUF6533 domain-containing protein n=1 Tax=Dichomitus squalens TaxID=114155 RepID=A0A4V2K724_9APHY|nr:hypothetical protein BD310DRAFT_936058 [Dichomitus squalens]
MASDFGSNLSFVSSLDSIPPTNICRLSIFRTTPIQRGASDMSRMFSHANANLTMSDGVELASLIAQAGNLSFYQIHKHIQTGAITCCILEIVATLPDEVMYMWPSDWSLMKVVYLFNKYSPLIDIVLLVLVDIVSRDPSACALRFQLLTYWFIIGTLCSEFILIARTYALW